MTSPNFKPQVEKPQPSEVEESDMAGVPQQPDPAVQRVRELPSPVQFGVTRVGNKTLDVRPRPVTEVPKGSSAPDSAVVSTSATATTAESEPVKETPASAEKVSQPKSPALAKQPSSSQTSAGNAKQPADQGQE